MKTNDVYQGLLLKLGLVYLKLKSYYYEKCHNQDWENRIGLNNFPI